MTRDLAAERVGRERHDVELDLLVAAAVFVGDFGVAHRHPAGDGVAQLFDQHGAAQVVFELGRASAAGC